MPTFDDLPPQPFTRGQARAHGLTDKQISRARRSGRLTGVRRGIMTMPGANSELPVEVTATLLAVQRRDIVVSHETAARLWGLPRPLDGWRNAQFTARTGTPRKVPGAHIRVAPLSDDDVRQLSGVAVTSPAPTVADCLRTLQPRDSLAIADAAWHRGLITDQSLLAAVAAQAGWPGVVGARKVLAHADSRRESPLESWSAWGFARARLPRPEWQALIRDGDSRVVGRVDCWWPAGVVGEADGRSKYVLASAERGGGSEAVFEALHSERAREQRLRALGVEVIRWTAADVLVDDKLRQLARRITSATAEALAHPRFSGNVSVMHPPYAR
jgi:putative AbiEi antitoxin of type IV toxin-antitoxin system